MTDYRILRFQPENSVWAPVGEERAANPKQALRQWHEREPLTESGLNFAVVPDRNWTVLTTDIVTETKLKFA